MRRFAFLTAVAVAAMLVVPSPASGGAAGIDAAILGGLTDNYRGEGVFTPPQPISEQTARARTRIGRMAEFEIKYENIDGGPDFYIVQGCRGNNKFAVQYRSNNNNVTSEVVDGDYETPLVADGDDREDFEVKVKVKDNADVGDIKKCKVTFESDFWGSTDSVRGKVKVKAG